MPQLIQYVEVGTWLVSENVAELHSLVQKVLIINHIAASYSDHAAIKALFYYRSCIVCCHYKL